MMLLAGTAAACLLGTRLVAAQDGTITVTSPTRCGENRPVGFPRRDAIRSTDILIFEIRSRAVGCHCVVVFEFEVIFI